MVSAIMVKMKTVSLLGCLLYVCAIGTVDSSADTCKTKFTGDPVQLCHGQDDSTKGKTPKCPNDWTGFVLTNLVIAPQHFYQDCERYHNLHLYNASCLGQETQQQQDYDRIVFDLLDKVSGQNVINSSMVVQPFPVGDVFVDQEGDGGHRNSSAFIAFQERCKPAYPGRSANQATMIRMCSNQTVSGDSRVYLTLRGTEDIPQTPSMCRCVLRPSVDLKLVALDVRLQNRGIDHKCGQAAIKIEAEGSAGSQDIRCESMSALYGSQILYTSSTPTEVTVTLSSVSASDFPTAVWLEAQDKWEPKSELLTVSCEGFIAMEQEVPDSGEDVEDTDHNREDFEGDEEEPADAGADFAIILGSVLGGIGFVILIVILVIIIRKKYGGGEGLTCGHCCDRDSSDVLDMSYKAVPQEPVYAEPGNPHPSTSTPLYTFPADAKLPGARPLYSEPDPNGTLAMAADAATPPPLPDSPPPGSPPPVTFPPGTPPPKPERTLLRPRKDSSKSTGEEESYDHIVAGGRSRLKNGTGRDGQNNIIRDQEAGPESQVYCHLQNTDDYSTTGFSPKQVVKDNVYDTTA